MNIKKGLVSLAVLAGLSSQGCVNPLVNPNDYQTVEEQERAQAYNRSALLSGLSFGLIPGARTIQQAAVLNALGHTSQTNAIGLRQGLQENYFPSNGADIYCFVARGLDKNNNNVLDKNEMLGLGSTFSAGSPIEICAVITKPVPQLDLFVAKNGKTVRHSAGYNSTVVQEVIPSGQLPPGDYEVVIGVGNRRVDKKDISIR